MEFGYWGFIKVVVVLNNEHVCVAYAWIHLTTNTPPNKLYSYAFYFILLLGDKNPPKGKTLN